MPVTYPPVNPTVTNDVLTISRFLNNPTAVSRRLRTMAENRFIADALLTGRVEGASIIYETDESQYTNRPPEIVAPGGQYPRALAAPGTSATANVVKWGQEVPVTDESVGRFRGQAAEKAMTKIVNYLVYQVDTTALAVIAAAVTNSVAATAVWDATTANPLIDILRARAKVRAQNKGYEPDVIVVDDYAYAYLIGNAMILAGLAREAGTSVTITGEQLVIAGLRVMATPNLPTAGTAMVVDTTMLGSMGYERIPSPEYQGDPATGIETLVRRNPAGNDETLIRGRRPVVPFVQESGAACGITGLGTLTD